MGPDAKLCACPRLVLPPHLNVLLLACCLEAVGKPFPLITNELLEASTSIKQGAVKIEDHGLNIRSHLSYNASS